MTQRIVVSIIVAAIVAIAPGQVVSGRGATAAQASSTPSQATPATSTGTASPAPRSLDGERRNKVRGAASRIEEAAKRRMQQWHLPGLFYGVIVDGELVTSNSLGVRDVEAQAPVTPDTVFRIASMSKSFTVLAILKLRDGGKLALDDPISKYIPEAAAWAYPTRDSAPITIRNLLNHAEGFPEDNPWGDRQLGIPGERMTAWLRDGIPFSNVPGIAYEYSNFGFAILGRIVSVASKQPYVQYMAREILQPLGLTSSYWETKAVPGDRIAHGYRWQDEKWLKEVPEPDGAFGPMGGLYTSGRDLARYVAFHMGAWPPRDDAEQGPVRRSSLREMHQGWRHASFVVDRSTPDGPVTGNVRAYAYGLAASQDCQLGYTVAHGGGLPGYGSHMIWLPDVGVGVIAMANVTYAPASVFTRDVLDILKEAGALTPRAVQPSSSVLAARDAIVGMLGRWDDAAVNGVVANNLFMDRSADRRRAEVERIREEVGQCSTTSRLEPENWLRAQFRADCERGWVNVTFTLAPTRPPRIQYLEFQVGKPLTAAMRAAAEGLAAAIGGSGEAGKLRPQTDALRLHYGTCRLADVLAGDGDTTARVRFACDRGRFDAQLSRDASASEVTQLRMSRVPGDACVP